jgi:hypothetical protein
MATTKAIVPIVTFVVDGEEYSFPLQYDMFIELGNKMQFTKQAVAIVENMSQPFALMAMDWAERAQDPAKAVRDRHAFIGEVEHMLFHLAPQSFIVSAPIHMLEAVCTMEEMQNLIVSSVEVKPNAVLVIGRNMVRTYAMITPFFRDADKNFYYDKTRVIDSLEGRGHEEGLFSRIYEPCPN